MRVKEKGRESNITSLLVKRGELLIISTTMGTNYRKMAKNIHTSMLHLSLINWDKLKNIHHTMNTPLTCLTFSSRCLKQSVNKTFFTPFFARVFKRFCRAHVRFGFRNSHSWLPGAWVKVQMRANLLTCLLDTSARSILLRISRCGLTSSVSWNTGFLPDKGIYVSLKTSSVFAFVQLNSKLQNYYVLSITLVS